MTATTSSPEASRSILPLFVLSCLLFAYVAVRVSLVPITWDEAFNYLEFTRQGILLPRRFSAMAANNHYLNTWLTWLTTGVLGLSEFTLRLPTLTAYLLFLYSTARLSNELTTPLARVSAFVILNANPYMLDFFCLSRGYGIAYGLLAGSLWYLHRFFQSDLQVRYSRASLGLAILAVTAHLTLIHFLLALALAIVLATMLFAPAGTALVGRVAHALRVNRIALTAVGLFLLPIAFVVRGLRNAGALFYGGTTSFWRDTLVGVFEGSLYEKRYDVSWFPGAPAFALSTLLGALAVLLTVLALCGSIRAVVRGRHPSELFLPALVFILCSCALATIAQHHVLDVHYLSRRTALYLLIPGTLMVVVLADTMARAAGVWRWSLPVAAVVVALHLINCLNLTYVLEWKLSADVKRMLADVAEVKDATPAVGRTTVLGMNLEFEAPVNFYRLLNGLTWLNVADRRMKAHPLSDLYLYSDDDWRAVNADSFVVLKTYPLSNSRLLRRKNRPSHYETRFARMLDFEAPADSTTTLGATATEVAYGGSHSGLTDARHRQSGGIHYRPPVTRAPANMSLVAIRAMIWMKSLRNATARLVVAFERDRRAIAWQGIAVQDDALRARTWFPVCLTAFVPSGLQPGDRVSVYLSNKRDAVYIDDLEMQWITAVPAPPPANLGARMGGPASAHGAGAADGSHKATRGIRQLRTCSE